MVAKIETMEKNNNKLNKEVNILKEKLNNQEQAMLILQNIELSKDAELKYSGYC